MKLQDREIYDVYNCWKSWQEIAAYKVDALTIVKTDHNHKEFATIEAS